MSNAVAIVERDKVLADLSAGLRLSDIATDLHVTCSAISKVLSDDPEYQAAKESGHVARLDKVEAMIEAADEQVKVARATSLWRAYSWRAEREMPHIWGQRTELTVRSTPQLHIMLSAEQTVVTDRGNIVDHITDTST